MAAARLLIVFALSLLLFSQETKAQGNGAVRLFSNDNSSSRGIVEVYYSGRWGTICSTRSSGFIPNVVCHQLGYDEGTWDSSNIGTSPNSGVLRDVSCSISDYLVILQCYYQATTSCDASDYLVQVACNSSRIWDLPYTGMVRLLQNGNFAGQGIVQVYCGGWGAICTFNSDAADTICTQLGYTSASGISSVSNYNERVVYEYLSCSGVENCVHYCASCPASNATCIANAVVSVTCSRDSTDYGGSYRYTCEIDGSRTAMIVGIIIGALLFFIICLVAVTGISVCIYCCLGTGSTRLRNYYSTIDSGIGAAGRGTKGTNSYSTVDSGATYNEETTATAVLLTIH